MKITVIVDNETLTAEGDTIQEIIETCGYTIESVILLKDGTVVIEEEISDEDTVELLPVVSGG